MTTVIERLTDDQLQELDTIVPEVLAELEELYVQRDELLGALRVAVQYLVHPDVQAMPFALPASGAANRASNVIADIESVR